ncbi:MAG: AhpC/TSA family protein [Gloeobacteraceae cyanobacterium ES-bin-316]|nr:AhpC/TSA family protein [Ferruginibacter sp.]
MQSLQTELDAFQKSFNASVTEKVVTTFASGVEELRQSSITNNSLKVGDLAPDFILGNAIGKNISLSALLKNGPVVLTWYRGGWCPYCNIELRHLQKSLPQFQQYNAQLVALSPELPDKSLTTVEKNQLEFEVLTDYNNDVARKFGIVFKINEDLVEIYNGFHPLDTYNGVDTNELPIPATYIISPDFTIRYAYVEPDYRKRADPQEILKALSKL